MMIGLSSTRREKSRKNRRNLKALREWKNTRSRSNNLKELEEYLKILAMFRHQGVRQLTILMHQCSWEIHSLFLEWLQRQEHHLQERVTKTRILMTPDLQTLTRTLYRCQKKQRKQWRNLES